jgi:hypothetical protein
LNADHLDPLIAAEAKVIELEAEVDRLRAALHAHCPNCCNLKRHLGQTGWDKR